MAEFKLLDTKTELRQSGSSISIFTYYVKPDQKDDRPFIIEILICDTSGVEDGVAFSEGDMVVKLKEGKFPSQINIFLDSLGNLLINATDAKKYSISGNDLIYKK